MTKKFLLAIIVFFAFSGCSAVSGTDTIDESKLPRSSMKDKVEQEANNKVKMVEDKKDNTVTKVEESATIEVIESVK